MNAIFSSVPQFLKAPELFYASVQRGERLGAKALGLFVSALTFLAVAGFILGLSHSWLQALSTAAKLPLLFLLTLAITLPALYFFALALLNVRFSVAQAGVVVLSGVGVSAFLLLGLSPVALFFVFTSSSYAFFQLLAVAAVAVSGLAGLSYILRGFMWVDRDRALTRGGLGGGLLHAWVALYGFVGAQMTWRFSPLIGDPAQPFVLLQPSRDNFFVDVLNAGGRALGLDTLRGGADLVSVMLIGPLLVGAAFVAGALGTAILLTLRRKPEPETATASTSLAQSAQS